MTLPKRARITDVAELAGVSTMTVSRVLSQGAKVSDTKRSLVMQAIETLNYKPNITARRLASNKSFFLGLLYHDNDTSYLNKFLLNSLKSCRAIGHHLVVDEVDENVEESLATVKELIEMTQVDGIILLPPVCDYSEILLALQKAKIPFVRIAPDTQPNLSPYICIDDYQAAFDITQKLITQGHSKIGHIIGNPNQGASRLRHEGYLAALKVNHIEMKPEYIVQGDFTYDSGYNAAEILLSAIDRPTAIFAANDETAAAVIAVAHKKNIDVPQKLSVTGFDDSYIATSVSPHLTTIRQPIKQMAELAVKLLTNKEFTDSFKADNKDNQWTLDFEIIERDSSQTLDL